MRVTVLNAIDSSDLYGLHDMVWSRTLCYGEVLLGSNVKWVLGMPIMHSSMQGYIALCIACF